MGKPLLRGNGLEVGAHPVVGVRGDEGHGAQGSALVRLMPRRKKSRPDGGPSS